MSWNVQNLFDGVHNGGEYKEFDPAEKGWNESLFHDRLRNLSEIILETVPPFGPDLLVLMEIENINTLQQLNQYYLPQCGYHTPILSQNPKGVQTALLTRLPILSIQSYRMATPPPLENAPIRDIIRVELEGSKGNFFLFINHWKSRLGGIEKTEPYRLYSATLLSNQLKAITVAHPSKQSPNENKSIPLIVCGDFNETLDQFVQTGGRRITALMPFDESKSTAENNAIWKSLEGFADFTCGRGFEPHPLFFAMAPLPGEKPNSTFSQEEANSFLYNMWSWEEAPRGSYFFRGKWEGLDHIFVNGAFWEKDGLQIRSFRVVKNEKLLTASGTPKKWITSMRKGYSDHLPLLLEWE